MRHNCFHYELKKKLYAAVLAAQDRVQMEEVGERAVVDGPYLSLAAVVHRAFVLLPPPRVALMTLIPMEQALKQLNVN